MKKMYTKSIAYIVAMLIFAASVFVSPNVLASEIEPEVENNTNTTISDYDAYLNRHSSQ